MQRAGFWERGGAWVIAQNTLMMLVLIVSPLNRAVEGSQVWRWIGALFMVISAVYGVAGVIALGKNRTVFPSPRHGAELVESGIYRFVRHPLYGSVGFLVFGWGLFWRSIVGVVLAVVLAFVLREKARREEAWLCDKFPKYAAYRKRVKSVIPWLI
jgi:protein-S-isoprenylcysteine O-methyltransferase Ste14